MPTRENNSVFDGLLQAAGGLIDMKRQVDRVEQEIRTLKAQASGFVPPVARRVSSADAVLIHQSTRSESVTSTATSTTKRR